MPETSPIAATDSESLAPTSTGADGAAAATDAVDETTGEGSPLYDAVAEVVKVIRPAVQADEGDIFLRAVDQDSGVVSVELVGACVTCPASTQTLKQGLERILKQRVDGVTEVVHVGEELFGADEGTVVSL